MHYFHQLWFFILIFLYLISFLLISLISNDNIQHLLKLYIYILLDITNVTQKKMINIYINSNYSLNKNVETTSTEKFFVVLITLSVETILFTTCD